MEWLPGILRVCKIVIFLDEVVKRNLYYYVRIGIRPVWLVTIDTSPEVENVLSTTITVNVTV